LANPEKEKENRFRNFYYMRSFRLVKIFYLWFKNEKQRENYLILARKISKNLRKNQNL